MTAPLDLTDDERVLWRSFKGHVLIRETLQKLSDARAALRLAKDSLSCCILSSVDGKAQVDTEQWNTLVREDIADIDRALAGTTAPVAVPHPLKTMTTEQAAAFVPATDAEIDAAFEKGRRARDAFLGRSAMPTTAPVAVPTGCQQRQDPLHYGCTTCVAKAAAPDPAQAAYAECARIVEKLYDESDDGRISRSELVQTIAFAAARARGGK